MTTSASIDISIVIVNYNTRDLLEQCLRSIQEKAGNVTIETFVVDNASSDASCKMVQEIFPDVKLMPNVDNKGFATANNQAIRESVGRYVLLLNPDTIVLEGAFEATLAFMEKQRDAGIATCKVLNADRSFQICYEDTFPNLWSIVTGGPPLRRAIASLFMSKKYQASSGLEDRAIMEPHPVAWVMGAFMMIRRKVIEQIGMLDENLFMYGEEPDFCYRAKLAGWAMWYTPAGQIVHLGGQSTKTIDQAKVTNWLMTTSFYFYRKHKGKTYTLACYLMFLIASACKLIMYKMVEALPASDEKKQRRREKQLQMKHILHWCIRHNPVGGVHHAVRQ